MTSGDGDRPGTLKEPYSSDITPIDLTTSKPKALPGSRGPLFPDLSASTQEILARVQGASAGSITSEAAILANHPNTSITSMEKFPPPQSISNILSPIQRPGMASGMFDKSKLKSAFASALIPKAKTLQSQPLTEPMNQPAAMAEKSTSQNSIVQPEKTSQSTTVRSNPGPLTGRSDESTIEVMSSPAMPGPTGVSSTGEAPSTKLDAEKLETPKPKMKMNHTYVLPSGEIVNSGKGLGRGRPGIKRGPRKPKATSASSETQPVSRKRKRSSVASDTDFGQKSRSASHSASESGDEYAPQATQTRSGRQTQRPTTFVPPESPSQKKPHLDESTSTNVGKPSTKRKVYKGKEQSALCEHCLRGYGPLRNAIVFCDGCNRCWHQRCHDPMIPRKLVIDPNSEWFCNDCAAVQHKAEKAVHAHKNEAPPPTTAVKSPVAQQPSAVTAGKDYFNSLTKEKLVDLLVQAASLAPHLPLWQPSPPPPPPPAPPSATTTPQPAPSTREEAYPTPKNDPSAEEGEKEEDDDEEYRDEHAKLYPKPGNGVQLPPETEDLDMLLERPESSTFSHALREGIVEVVSRV